MITIAAIQQVIDQNDVFLRWIPTSKYITDCFTKNSISSYQLLNLIKNNPIKSHMLPNKRYLSMNN